MTTTDNRSPAASATGSSRSRARGLGPRSGSSRGSAVLSALIAANARTGAVSPRIRTRTSTGAPRPVEPLFGFDHWLGHVRRSVHDHVVDADHRRRVRGWRGGDTRQHPVLLMGIVTTLIVWQDPIMNWSPYAVYNPQLWHWPEDWPLVSLSPTVEPFLVIGYVMFYLGPYFPAIWILRKIQAAAPVRTRSSGAIR